MTRPFPQLLAVGLCTASTTSCTASGGDCVALPPALVVTVTDGASGQRICDASVTMSLSGGNALRLGPYGQYNGVPNNCVYVSSLIPATFDIKATRSGYLTTTVHAVAQAALASCGSFVTEAGADVQFIQITMSQSH